MPASVTLIATSGELAGQQFRFSERMTCVIGRHDECHPRIPPGEGESLVSRHHCMLDINPPMIRIRDFGSLNGTFVNGRKIGQRRKEQSPEEGRTLNFPQVDLAHGDQVYIGDVVFSVAIVEPRLCSGCGDELPEGEAERCDRCNRAPQPHSNLSIRAACGGCGKEVSALVTHGRAADYICDDCLADPAAVLKRLLARAAEPRRKELLAIEGYEIQRELGRGGMGAVFLARRRSGGELVAIKTMLPKAAATPRAEKQFLREMQISAALRHPNVVELRDCGCCEGVFFQTLEYCEGGSVADIMEKARGPLRLDTAVRITMDVLRGLEYAHSASLRLRTPAGDVLEANGLVHRDLKPHNILLARDGGSETYKVADFGLAKAFDLAGLSGLSATNAVGGTIAFMSRHQAVNFKYARPEVDVWSAAATLFFLLTCDSPREFRQGEDPWRIVLGQPARPIRSLNPSVPEALAKVIDHALIEKPEIPFKTAAELRRAVESVS